ncbi:MAG: cytochrome c family protein [Rickettsiales bacterium]|nr:cytochrome c family protein [Rickettsiales bacterium]
MDKFKIPFFAFLIAIFIVVGATLFADLFYRPKPMIKRGFEIQISTDGKVAKKEEKPVDLATLIKNANFDNGTKIFKKCATCHNANSGGGNKVGPNLFAIIGKKRAATASFKYSDAMLKKGGSWSRDDLNLFLTKPKDFIPGTKMGFPGLKKPQDRADVILYLEKH